MEPSKKETTKEITKDKEDDDDEKDDDEKSLIKVKLDSTQVAERIKTKGKYEKGTLGKSNIYKHIEIYDELKAKVTKTSNPPYLAEFKHSKDKNRKFHFIGLIDKTKLERSGFGIEKNHHKEIYAGHHMNDLREGRGVYKFKDFDDGKWTTSAIYMGYWRNNLKHKEGTFIWRKEENKKVKTYESCQLTAFVGFFVDDKYDYGLFVEDGDDYTLSLYYGKFLENKKNDEEGMFYYHSPTEFYVVLANVEDDMVLEGVKFDFDPADKKFKHYNHFRRVPEEEDFDEEDDMYETIKQSDKETDLDDEMKNKWETAKKFFMLIQKEKGDFVKIYNAAIEGEKTFKDIKTIDDFYNKVSISLKSLQGESAIKIDDKLGKAFPKTVVPKNKRVSSISQTAFNK